MLFLERFSEDGDLTAVSVDDLVDDADEGCLSCSVGSKQTEDPIRWNSEVDVVERSMICVALRYVPGD